MIETNFRPSFPKEAGKPKEMLSITQEGSKKIVRINYSSMDLIQTCMRKAKYSLHMGITNAEEAPATMFGSAIHKGLETWYSLTKAERNTDAAKEKCIAAFHEKAGALSLLEISDKRHPANGERILNAYFKRYENDSFEIYRDETGPIVERRVEFDLYEDSELKIVYFGTIDCVLRDSETGVILVVDHKTTSALGAEFYNRIKPNHQYTGYILGARRALGIDTDSFMVNGLQVAKTKCDLARQITTRTQEDFDELRDAAVVATRNYLTAISTNVWPQAGPMNCSAYGGCGYRPICEVNNALKPSIIDAMYRIKT